MDINYTCKDDDYIGIVKTDAFMIWGLLKEGTIVKVILSAGSYVRITDIESRIALIPRVHVRKLSSLELLAMQAVE